MSQQITEINNLKSAVIDKYNCQISTTKNEITAQIENQNQEQYQVKITLPDDNGRAFAIVQQITMSNGNNINEIADVNQQIFKSCRIYNTAGEMIFGAEADGKNTCNLNLLTIDVFNQIKSLFFLFLV